MRVVKNLKKKTTKWTRDKEGPYTPQPSLQHPAASYNPQPQWGTNRDEMRAMRVGGGGDQVDPDRSVTANQHSAAWITHVIRREEDWG